MIKSTYLFLPGFEDIAIVKEEWLHLINAAWCNEDEIEDRKESELHRESAVPYLPKGETTEKGCKDMKDDLVPHVVLGSLLVSARPPILRRHTGERQIWIDRRLVTILNWNQYEVA